MKKSNFTEAQIIFAIKVTDRCFCGRSVPEDGYSRGHLLLLQKKKKYGGLGVSELGKLRQLEEENHQLNRPGAGPLRLLAYLHPAHPPLPGKMHILNPKQALTCFGFRRIGS